MLTPLNPVILLSFLDTSVSIYLHCSHSPDKLDQHSLLQKWGDYLVQNSLHTNNAVSADGFDYPEMSNLALKGILGIYSMGKIDEVVTPFNTTFKVGSADATCNVLTGIFRTKQLS
jgi:hypothetical protein